ncbi:MAG: carboxylating nicotinate-nucleotide diphosphorylase [Pseudomonadota bacterium]
MDTLHSLILLALQEDSGLGDITSESLFPTGLTGTGIIVAKEPLVLAGVNVAARVFTLLDPHCETVFLFDDGDTVSSGDTVFSVKGDIIALLKGERVALNFMQRLSGIATLTRTYVTALGDSRVRLTDTRKTVPGWRVIEKAAVRAGGAYNHRFSLYDGVLIKDNHIAVSGNIASAVSRVRARVSHLMKIEVETSTLAQVQEALDAGAEVIMLDNMTIDLMKEAVALIKGRALVEASGNITLDTIRAVAATGVDVISTGALTHQARAVDLSMRISV